MTIKIFSDQKTICLTDEANDFIKETKMFHEYKEKKKLFEFIKKFQEDNEQKEAFIYAKDFKKLSKQFLSSFHVVKAAGGVVKNNAGQFLVIKRLGKWDLPKGKSKKNERQKHAAVREVSEECKISRKDIELINKTYTTYHTYGGKEKLNLKKTDWFEMKYTGTKEPSPQTEESITEALWFNPSQTQEFTENTFPSLIDVLNSVKF